MEYNLKRRIIIIAVAAFVLLWFSGFLPKQVVKIVAGNYMSKQEDGNDYKLKDVEYSPAHDCYFVYYYEKENPSGGTRNIGIYYRWLPFDVYFDSAYPG